MSKILTTMAAAALMASTAIAPAFAQTTAPAPAAPAEQTAPADTMAKPADPAMKSDMKSADAGAAGTYLTEQAATQVAASDYMGKSIYNAEDKSIGDVNDLILEENGGVVAAVVGVGGFLGIGEKNVAIPMDKLTVTREDNSVRLTTTETAESLQAAPKFMTLAEQQSAATSGTDATTTSSTAAPATPAAPGAAPADNATTPATPAKP